MLKQIEVPRLYPINKLRHSNKRLPGGEHVSIAETHMDYTFRYVNKYSMFIQNACSISIFEFFKLFLINQMIDRKRWAYGHDLYVCA